ncbi:MAG: AmmeMemoRadiSam system protein B [Planctomycetes bacterium]|nr:AmmeMemoRadiSam system protein B [Planctomycetota bacterium]
MPNSICPHIRPLELVPMSGDDAMYVLRDPYGFSKAVALPMVAGMLVTLMNGERSLPELQEEFEKTIGQSLSMEDIERIVQQLDESCFLDNDRFSEHRAAILSAYQELEVRPAAHAGGAYPGEVDELRALLEKIFTCEDGPGLLPWEGSAAADFAMSSEQRLCGVMSPHIDFHRGGPAFAWAYDRVVTESDAEVFVVLGTAHTPLKGFYSVSRKHFDTPLGTVSTDRDFVDDLQRRLLQEETSKDVPVIFDDEMPHRREHSIEFQALMLQYILGGRRDFQIVPILVGSFHPFVLHNRSPGDSPVVADFVSALRAVVAATDKKVCFVAGVDLAHIGKQFGDENLLDDERLKQQWADDQHLLANACEGDPEGWFIHVASQEDRNRICGLAPTYTMLEAMRPERGELLKYDQAVSEDRSSCVSFASMAFYE